MGTVPNPNSEESRWFNLGKISAYDDVLERLAELRAEVASTRASLTLPTRFPRQGGEQL